jgi:hypothetical protein
MATHGILATLANALIASTLCACGSIGPPTVERERIDDGSTIANSWKQQALLNIAKLNLEGRRPDWRQAAPSALFTICCASLTIASRCAGSRKLSA